MRRLFGSKRRETVWLRAIHPAGFGHALPICPHCRLPVAATDDWDECHLPGFARAQGAGNGVEHVTVGHRRCNNLHAARELAPALAKEARVRRKFIGAQKPGMGPRRMRGGRRDDFKIAIGGGIKPRLTGAQQHAAFLARRYGAFAEPAP
jgi:hypothetical protein